MTTASRAFPTVVPTAATPEPRRTRRRRAANSLYWGLRAFQYGGSLTVLYLFLAAPFGWPGAGVLS